MPREKKETPKIVFQRPKNLGDYHERFYPLYFDLYYRKKSDFR